MEEGSLAVGFAFKDQIGSERELAVATVSANARIKFVEYTSSYDSDDCAKWSPSHTPFDC